MIQGEEVSQLKKWHGPNYKVSGGHLTSAAEAELIVADNL